MPFFSVKSGQVFLQSGKDFLQLGKVLPQNCIFVNFAILFNA